MLTSFSKDIKGNFGIILALGVGVLALGVGVAVDTSGATKARQTLQASLDLALLAAAANASQGFMPEEQDGDNYDYDYAADVHEFMIANGYNPAMPAPTVKHENSFLIAQASEVYVPTFGKLLGLKEMNLNVVSEVTLRGSAKVQIALVLDNTNSMNSGGKMTALKSGARDLVNAVRDGGSQSEIAIIPFSKYVRIDTSHRGSPWLVVPTEYDTDRTWQQATHTGGTCELVDQEYNVDGIIEIRPTTVCKDQITTYETQHRVIESRWEGCVGVRNKPLDSLDGGFVTPVPALLNTIPTEVTGLHVDVKSWCPRTITPLTNDYTKLHAEINELYGTGVTYIPAGLTWGHRVLSPIVPFDESLSENPVRNIMVIMTDGKNTAEFRDTTETRQNYEAPPYIYRAEDDEAVPLADRLTTELCTQIKAQGTEIYTIAFQVTDAAARSIVQNCASSNKNAFVASDNTGLVRAFGHIASSLESVIRLSK